MGLEVKKYTPANSRLLLLVGGAAIACLTGLMFAFGLDTTGSRVIAALVFVLVDAALFSWLEFASVPSAEPQLLAALAATAIRVVAIAAVIYTMIVDSSLVTLGFGGASILVWLYMHRLCRGFFSR